MQSRVHVVLAGILVLALLTLQAALNRKQPVQTPNLPTPAMIAFEHTSPLEVDVAIGTKDKSALLQITNRSSETISVSVPTEWKRGEVKGASVSAVTSEVDAVDFTRWQLPSAAGVTFTSTSRPAELTLINAVSAILTAHVTHIDLITKGVNEDTYIVTTQVRVPLSSLIH